MMKVSKKRSRAGWLVSLLVVTLFLSACSGAAEKTQTAAVVPTSSASTLPATQATPTTGETPGKTMGTPTVVTTAVETPTVETLAPNATQAQATQTEPIAATAVPAGNVTSFPDPAGYAWNPVVKGLTNPTDIISAPDGSGRLFVLEQPGDIRIIKDGSLLPDPFLDIQDRVQSGGTEQGLLGIAFHPDYATNGYFYVNYTSLEGIGDTHISRFKVSDTDPNRADPQSEKILLKVTQPFQNHNGGQVAFGPDGFLYLGLGDGGSANDPRGNGQSLDTFLGKLLRIDVNSGDPYAIPPDNPFAGGGGKPEIWAYGLRNPWRFSFDRSTGDLFIADVGQNQWEEVDFQGAGEPGGVNYGWNFLEGTHPLSGEPPSGVKLADPIYEYQHGPACSITGGYVYRGKDLPEFNGIYLFSDFCSGQVWGTLRTSGGEWQTQELFQTGYNVTTFGQDSNGEIYLTDQSSGTVFQLERK